MTALPCPYCKGKGHLPEHRVMLSPQTGEVAVGWSDRVVRLTPSPFVLLALLVRNMPNVVEHDALIRRLWGLCEPDDPDTTLKVHICKIRQQVRCLGLEVENVFGVGYRLKRVGVVESTSDIAAEIRAVAHG